MATASSSSRSAEPTAATRFACSRRSRSVSTTSSFASASRLLAEKCVDGIEANREQCERYAELTLSAATALNPYIGYDKASEIVKAAAASGRSLREVAREAGVDDATLDEALDYRKMARANTRAPS